MGVAHEARAERVETSEAQLDASLEELDRVLAEGTPGEQLLQRLQQTVEETGGDGGAATTTRMGFPAVVTEAVSGREPGLLPLGLTRICA